MKHTIIHFRLGLRRSSGRSTYRAEHPPANDDWIEYSISFDDQGREHTFEMVEELTFTTNNARNVSVQVEVNGENDMMEMVEIANIASVSRKVQIFVLHAFNCVDLSFKK